MKQKIEGGNKPSNELKKIEDMIYEIEELAVIRFTYEVLGWSVENCKKTELGHIRHINYAKFHDCVDSFHNSKDHLAEVKGVGLRERSSLVNEIIKKFEIKSV